MKRIDLKEHFKTKEASIIAKLINEIQALGYEVKINVYNNGRKELRILAK